ncbi:Tetratricopeptide repeat-containing protein [Ekhidna lutea]|uniref:Tetratricopeptide repeat-containing protein n=1 Tax=Ekhidna lutea TaxID=447679 RepID=A0A239LA90_EKHLU|nr:tetratricopeptide repeat protein [Ekhidna lutea]SNT27195.1 Tetratricopeptide repeat-containing protein [Ekhidna lutea]
MKFLLIILALVITDPKEIAKVNTLKKQAEEAYLNGDYEDAIDKYTMLHDSLDIEDAAVQLNLAHSYYHLGDTSGAKNNYNKVFTSSNNKLKSIALQQLGVMNKDAGRLEEALQQLKSAIKADPTNQKARYNYEVVKKLLQEQEQQQQNQQNQDQENKDGEEQQEQQNKDEQEKKDGDQENQENQNGEQDQEKSDEQKEQEEQQKQDQQEGEEQEQEKSQDQITKEKLEEMGISEEKARQLLEAMRQSEIKYLQHQRRKPTKRPPSGKPDW